LSLHDALPILEWARLLLAVDATLGADAPAGLREAAVALAAQAVEDGWDADGAEGFVYTTDWSGEPVVRARMHWVVTEAIATSTVLERVTGDPAHGADLERWWVYADSYLVDREGGSWHHELDPANRPAAGTWEGKPAVYHAYQAALMADVPPTPSFRPAPPAAALPRARPPPFAPTAGFLRGGIRLSACEGAPASAPVHLCWSWVHLAPGRPGARWISGRMVAREEAERPALPADRHLHRGAGRRAGGVGELGDVGVRPGRTAAHGGRGALGAGRGRDERALGDDDAVLEDPVGRRVRAPPQVRGHREGAVAVPVVVAQLRTP